MVGDDTDEAEQQPEHDVLIRLPLGNHAMGTVRERADLAALADELEAAVAAEGVGEYDGDEVGGGEYTLFFAGPDGNLLFAVLQRLLHRNPLARGAVAVVQLGEGEPEERRL